MGPSSRSVGRIGVSIVCAAAVAVAVAAGGGGEGGQMDWSRNVEPRRNIRDKARALGQT